MAYFTLRNTTEMRLGYSVNDCFGNEVSLGILPATCIAQREATNKEPKITVPLLYETPTVYVTLWNADHLNIPSTTLEIPLRDMNYVTVSCAAPGYYNCPPQSLSFSGVRI